MQLYCRQRFIFTTGGSLCGHPLRSWKESIAQILIKIMRLKFSLWGYTTKYLFILKIFFKVQYRKFLNISFHQMNAATWIWLKRTHSLKKRRSAWSELIVSSPFCPNPERRFKSSEIKSFAFEASQISTGRFANCWTR